MLGDIIISTAQYYIDSFHCRIVDYQECIAFLSMQIRVKIPYRRALHADDHGIPLTSTADMLFERGTGTDRHVIFRLMLHYRQQSIFHFAKTNNSQYQPNKAANMLKMPILFSNIASSFSQALMMLDILMTFTISTQSRLSS